MKQKLIFLAALFTATFAFSAEYYVDASRTDDTGFATNWLTAKQTIQAAVDLTTAGDTVWVTNGIYTRIVVTNAISIRSVNGPEETNINGEGARCVKLASEAMLNGFSVTNGYARGGSTWHDGCGGGIFCDFPSTNTVITNCVIRFNRAQNRGGGASGGVFFDCIIRSNEVTSGIGGGVSHAVLDGCRIAGNLSYGNGGGAYDCQLSSCHLWDNEADVNRGAGGGSYSCDLSLCTVVSNRAAYGGGSGGSVLRNSLLFGNQAELGGGVFKSTLINCTVTENIATNSAGDASGGGAYFTVLRNSIVFNNSADTNADYFYSGWNQDWGFDAQYSCFSEAPNGLSGNISSNPTFVNATSGNYRLQSNSLCVNAGFNADAPDGVDLDENSRVVNTYVDMGAYESAHNTPRQYIRDFLPATGVSFSETNTVYLSATGGGSGNPVIFSALLGCPVVWINSTTMQFSAGGDVYIIANQAGDSYYDAAIPVTNHYIVPYMGTFYVDVSQPDDTGASTNWATAKKTIQAAVNLATDGSSIWVTNGLYLLSKEVFITNAISVQSANGPGMTIVDGGGGNRCFSLQGDCLVSGFTITNGGVRFPEFGGGVYCSDEKPVVSNCYFISNAAGVDFVTGWAGNGGGMYKGTALDCVFDSNGAHFGGGMAQGIAQNCIFKNNYGIGGPQWGDSYGAGMSGGEAQNCLFVENTNCFYGAGMRSGTAINCTFVGNWARFDGSAVDRAVVYNGIFKQNISGIGYSEIVGSEVYYSCATQLISGVNGNITNLPLFVNAAGRDFRLMSNSPCINWGNHSVVSSATDLDGNPRIIEDVIDMGAYEYQGVLGLTDSDGDGIPDDWERQHGGNQNPERTCSNRINKVRQAYIAGLNPNDPNSQFLTSALRFPTSSVLGWNATSGRVYSVWWTTNLLNGFQSLETDIPWTANSYTDDVHNADGQMYYKIDVQLENKDGDEATTEI